MDIKFYKGDNEIWDAFKKGKRLCTFEKERMTNLETSPGFWYKKLYYFTNPQMNRYLVKLDNDSVVDCNMNLWEVHCESWVDYDEREQYWKEFNEKEMTIEEIESKLGYKIKIVANKK
jgi:hypothetical protein